MDRKEKAEGKKHFLSSKGQRVMLIGTIVCVVVCAVLFSLLGVFMGRNSNNAVDYIGEKTMREASYQFTQRFAAVMDQRIKMVTALVEDYRSADSEEERQQLENSAKARGFKYLAFIRVNKEFIDDEEAGRTMDYIFGDFIVSDLLPFRNSILNREEKIAVGRQITQRDADGNPEKYGEDIVLCAVPAEEHTMPNDDESAPKAKSMALIAGFSNEDFIGSI